jgi:mono/diheme cytochrome c family protein
MLKWLMAGMLGLAGLLAIFLLSTNMPKKEISTTDSQHFTIPERAVDAGASQEMYKKLCISCHGDQMQGVVGPSLAHIGADMTKEQIYKVIMDGRSGMPPFKDQLSEEEIITITTWLASLQ